MNFKDTKEFASVRIPSKLLPDLMERILEALKSGGDLEIQGSTHPEVKYLYTKVSGGQIKLLGQEGEGNLRKEESPEDLSFSPSEIELMETHRECPETDEIVDMYTCKYLCPIRKECGI